ncbi:nucleoside diphosphate-linked moiety X motif 19, mitochondrial [Chaetomidium leptoderma]|uniref:Nucleoside diphosphate-linked moiety X motif 19, mitochondrial n=1 Tax=Chaetomidium leptoderma TaxID=669021 RepID=A0AAN6VNQ2_9PEZI|nr:nucleoside diphosphate-linked moiety X motif 19, mitochondrial [Chaetomidium leptoderma]
MPGQEQGKAPGDKKSKKPPPPVRPSSSILLLSPTNQVLLLHRVHTSSSFASAHVFPGGNLSSFHDGSVPAADTPAHHEDGPAYRLAAIRETFEESGILLAKKSGQSRDQGLLHVPDDVREAGRKEAHGNQAKFTEWLKDLGGEPDVENLIPFTRWITPPGPQKRFTTQMYLYMLPLSLPTSDILPLSLPTSDILHPDDNNILPPIPTHDGGLEHTAATFDDAHTWLAKARAAEIILFPPQLYLLHLVSAFLHHLPPRPRSSSSPSGSPEQPIRPSPERSYQSQRDALLAFLQRTPAASSASQQQQIPWSDKVMSPAMLFVRRRDGRIVLGLDKPGPELKGSGRGGDWERVVLVNFRKEGPRDVEVRLREEVVREEREDEEELEAGGAREGEGGAKL